MLTDIVASILGIDKSRSATSLSTPIKKTSSFSRKKNSLLDGSTAGSTPTSALSLVEEATPFFNLCCHAEDATDRAVSVRPSLADDEDYDDDDDVNEEEDEIQWATTPHRTASRMLLDAAARAATPFGQKTDAACLDERRNQSNNNASSTRRKIRDIKPPKSIAVYQPHRSWPDGTLQILWQVPERNVHGMNGIDRFEAHLELTLDDLSTIDIASDGEDGGSSSATGIASKYSGLSIELHPDETRVHKIGSISCYRVRAEQALKQIDQLDVPPECPEQLSELLYQLPEKSFFQSWGKPQKAKRRTTTITKRIRKRLPLGGEEGVDDDEDDEIVVVENHETPEDDEDNDEEEDDDSVLQQDVFQRHNWHPESTRVSSYLWIEDVQVDKRYRGSGLGFCLLEDACKRVADSSSWLLANVPETLSGSESGMNSLFQEPLQHPLRDYFGLFGFHPLLQQHPTHDAEKNTSHSSFMARWNNSPANPRLEEVLPSVPFTTQQSRDQGFQL